MITKFKIFEKKSSDFKKYVIYKFEKSNVMILFEVLHKWGNKHRIIPLYRNDAKGFQKYTKFKYGSLTTSSIHDNTISEFDELQDAIDYFKTYLQSIKYNI